MQVFDDLYQLARPDPLTYPWAAREHDLRMVCDGLRVQLDRYRLPIHCTQDGRVGTVIPTGLATEALLKGQALRAQYDAAWAAHEEFMREWRAAGRPA